MLNNWSGVGRLTKDPETRTISQDTLVCNFTIAINRPFKNESGEHEADFIQCQAWKKQAEFVGTYLTKGQLVAVTGAIHTRTYEKEDKSTAYVTEINVDSIQSLEKRDPATEDQIKTRWTQEWDKRSVGLDAKKKSMLKKELADKYQPMIDALKVEKQSSIKVIEDDLPF